LPCVVGVTKMFLAVEWKATLCPFPEIEGKFCTPSGGTTEPSGAPMFVRAPEITVLDAPSQTNTFVKGDASIVGPRFLASDWNATRPPSVVIDALIDAPSPFAPAGEREISWMSALAAGVPNAAAQAVASSTAIAVLGPARILPPPSSLPGRATVLPGRGAHKRAAS